MAVIEEKKEIVSEDPKVVKKTVKKSSDKKETIVTASHSDIAYRVLVEPWITEKTHKAMTDNKYTFKVIRGANKKQVKLAIEGIYGVKTEKINVVNIKPKKKAYGRHEGTKAGFKKATLTLKEGNKIELFQGA